MISQPLGRSFLQVQSVETLQRRFIQALAGFAMLMTLVVMLIAAGTQNGEGNVPLLALFVTANGLVLLALERFALSIVARGVIALLAAAVVVSHATQVEAYTEALALLAIAAAAVLGSQLIYRGASLVVFGVLLLELVEGALASGIPTDERFHPVLVMLTAGLVSLVTRTLTHTMQNALTSAARSADLITINTEIGQIATRTVSMNDLLSQVIELLRRRFGYYHVQVFLLNDTRDQAVLIASTGEVGQRLLVRRHRLAVGSQSVVGQATLRGEPVLVRDTLEKSVHARNELLPETRSELALPIFDGQVVIGALNAQSMNADAFEPDVISALVITTNLLATAIRHARLHEQQTRTVEANEQLRVEAQANLREIERLNQQLTRTGWENFHLEEGAVSGVTLEGNRLSSHSFWTKELIEAGEHRRPVTTVTAGRQVVAVPVILRGEVIGAIEVEPDDQSSGEDTVDMMQAVAQRLAISLDNARLFEEAQEATAQEQYINDIVSRYQTVNTVDDLLRITLTELSQSLGAQHGSIRLGRLENGGTGDA